jgi:glutathione peroxidase
MKNLFTLLFVLTALFLNAQSFYDKEFKINGLMGETIECSSFKGKKVLIVNVASKCGYTPQYAGLQKLYDTHIDNLVIIGFPCNQFMSQEPGGADEINSFCQKNYGVTFLMTEKIDVKGDEQNEVYSWLTQKAQNGFKDSKVKWNFQKYLLDEEGKLIAVFPSNVKPQSTEITSLL